MDENTTAEQLHHRAAPRSNGPLGRRRRSLAAAALLLSLAATVSACNSDGSAKNTAAASSTGASATGSPSGSASGSASPTPSAGGSAGAGTTTAPGSAQPSAPAGNPTPSAPIKSAPGTPAPAQPTTPGGGAPSPVTPLPVDPQAQLKPSSYLAKGNQLTIFFFGGVCDKYGLKADESKAGQVTVQVVITQKPPAGQNCPDLVKQQGVTTDLAQPLQGRTVLSSTGADVPLESAPNGGPVSASN
ncbi:hypothetical protein [Kitasatospora sp. NBC_01302]|uniref:hypothetical protein n=1 Tax=Kitasatospora sp. NBC_01302 TaxID=2903575 RepID=UPI002E11D9B5|nr:hypothetical protein OG294_29235 [Kitasatospora sp. NBC_01302]